jgi:sulfoxide reductase heme-binding subunit YedZ
VHLVAATVGFVSLFLLWLTVVWGMILRTGWASTRIRHSTVYGVHMVLALLGLCLGFVHAFAQLANPTGTVYLVHVLVPFVNPLDRVGIGVGVVALELLTALVLSVLIQRRLGYARWRAVHTFAYVAFTLLVVHVLVSGSETTPGWVVGTILGAWLLTVLIWLASSGLVTAARRTVHRGLTERRKGQELIVSVDALRCNRFGFCEHEAPEVFRLRADGRVSYRPSVPLDQAEAVIRAVDVCPARAISLNQLPTRVFTPRPTDPVPEAPSSGGGALDGGSGRHRVVGLDARRYARRGGGR